MEIVTRESIKEKAAAAFGFNMPNPEDVIHREDYDSDAEYAVALAQMTQTMSTPEYRAAARKVGVAAQQRSEEEERKQQKKEFAEIRKTVTLSEVDERIIDEKARQLAKDDLAAGKITVSQYSNAVLKYADTLTKKALDTKAGNRMFNAKIRREIDAGKITD